MTSTSVHDMHRCSNCGNPASHTCKACKGMPNATDGNASSTWYCGSECQKAHWTEHKAQCKSSQARQALYRAAAIAKKIFYAFMKNSFMWNPGRIEKIGTTWLIRTSVYTGTSQVVPFPYDIFPDVHEQEALLTYQGCNTAVSNMHNLVKALLGDLCSNIDEVSHFVKNAQHHLKRVYNSEGPPMIDGTDYVHTIIRVKLKNEETYALDLTGAQYGWTEFLMPWKHYMDTRVRKVRDIVSFGQTKAFCKTRAENTGGQGKWVWHLKEGFAGNMDDAVTWWQRGNMSTANLLRLPGPEFEKKLTSLLDVVEQFLHLHKAIQESHGTFKIKGGFTDGFDRKFTSAVPGMILGRQSTSEKTG